MKTARHSRFEKLAWVAAITVLSFVSQAPGQRPGGISGGFGGGGISGGGISGGFSGGGISGGGISGGGISGRGISGGGISGGFSGGGISGGGISGGGNGSFSGGSFSGGGHGGIGGGTSGIPRSSFPPPISGPREIQIPIWKCTRCGANLGAGPSPFPTCPGCGARISNSIPGNPVNPPAFANPTPSGNSSIGLIVGLAIGVLLLFGGLVGVIVWLNSAAFTKKKKKKKRKRVETIENE